MQRFAASILAFSIGFAPATGALAAEGNGDASAFSNAGLSFLSVTDFALNPTAENWISVAQQIKAHPCYVMVGEEEETCRDKYGLTMELRATLSGANFSYWLHDAMVDSVCGNQTGSNYVTCVMGVPTLGAADVARYRQQLDGSLEATEDAGMFDGGTSETNAELFDRAGTPLTTRQHAIEIIAESEENDEMTPYERSTMLWEWCADTHMGQSGCFHSFQRFVNDPSIDNDTIKAVIEANGRAGSSDDEEDEDE